jgi:hypothetical protein
MKANSLPKFLIALLLLTLTTSFSTLFASVSTEYKVKDFSLGRKTWDEFNITFNIQNVISKNNNINPDSYKIEMIGEDGTVLRTVNNKKVFTIEDKNLGSGEKLTFRFTAEIKGETVTLDRIDYASQKSIIIDNEINLPIENHISVGDVKLACKLMRTKFKNSNKWEVVGTFSDVAVSLFVSNGNANDYVEVPLNKKNTEFDLAQYKYFDDLKMQMERDLRKTNNAVVKYYFQFNWDRNVYIVDGGSKNINVGENLEYAVVKKYSTDIQKLVTPNTYTNGNSISASAE